MGLPVVARPAPLRRTGSVVRRVSIPAVAPGREGKASKGSAGKEREGVDVHDFGLLNTR